MSFDRLPSIPLVTNDPYFSIWLPHDTPTDVNTVHWTDAPKRIQGVFQVDGKRYGFLGRTGCPVMPCLQDSGARVLFSDWYSTVNCDSVGFKARSVQGGVFMPLLMNHAVSGYR